MSAAIAGALYLADAALRFGAYRDRIVNLTLAAGWVKVAGLYGLTAAATLLIFASALSVPRIGPHLTGGLLAPLFAVNMTYQFTAGRFLGPADARIIRHSDANAILGAIAAYAGLRDLIFLALGLALGAGAFWSARRWRTDWRWREAAAILLVSLVFHAALWNHLYSELNDYPVEPVTHAARTVFYVEKENREFFGIERDPAPPLHRAGPPQRNLVFIIDEAVRFDFVSVNHPDADATPALAEFARRDPAFYNCGLTLAASTCSFSTKVMLFTGVARAPDLERRAVRNPTLFDHARAAGYRTIVLDAPGSNFPNIAVRRADLEAVDLLLRADEIPGPHDFIDLNAAEFINRTTRESTGNFIVLIKRGAHFHYETAYPGDDPRYNRFQPKLAPGERYEASVERTRNSYKNALGFAIDGFLQALDPASLPDATTVLWTSDHGESLQERGPGASHCSGALEQAVVPTFVYSRDPWVAGRLFTADPAPSVFISHHHLHPTIVSILREEPETTHGAFASLLSSAPVAQAPLRYMHGGLWAQSVEVEVTPEDLRRFLPQSHR